MHQSLPPISLSNDFFCHPNQTLRARTRIKRLPPIRIVAQHESFKNCVRAHICLPLCPRAGEGRRRGIIVCHSWYSGKDCHFQPTQPTVANQETPGQSLLGRGSCSTGKSLAQKVGQSTREMGFKRPISSKNPYLIGNIHSIGVI